MTPSNSKAASKPRNNGFKKSHQQIIEAAIRLISEKGVEAVTIAELARALNVNRTTIYYHFKNREMLIAEVKQWASEQLSKGLDMNLSQRQRIDYITQFVLTNSELIALWIGDLITGNDIHKSYPLWDEFVAGMRLRFENEPEEKVDVEILCLNLLITAIITPRVLKNSVCPEQDIETITERFRAEHLRNLTNRALLED